MFGKTLTFDGELEPVRVDTRILEASFRNALEEMFGSKYQSLHVDVASRQSPSKTIEWRINVPPFESKLYVAISEMIREASSMMQLFVDLGTLLPQEFTVSIWLLSSDESAIIGSFDR